VYRSLLIPFDEAFQFSLSSGTKGFLTINQNKRIRKKKTKQKKGQWGWMDGFFFFPPAGK
jgi:hypothetical protein